MKRLSIKELERFVTLVGKSINGKQRYEPIRSKNSVTTPETPEFIILILKSPRNTIPFFSDPNLLSKGER